MIAVYTADVKLFIVRQNHYDTWIITRIPYGIDIGTHNGITLQKPPTVLAEKTEGLALKFYGIYTNMQENIDTVRSTLCHRVQALCDTGDYRVAGSIYVSRVRDDRNALTHDPV